jgi:DNA-directed RNA polymerase subunit RPC12/RpoP
MQENNPIIVFNTFNSSIEANIIKAKLDAFGIPCFLSEENLTMLTTPLLSGGIRLHLFERDRQQAQEILMDDLVRKSDDDDVISCPYCRSKRILNVSRDQFDPAKVVKYILQLSKRHYCLDCEAEFDH